MAEREWHEAVDMRSPVIGLAAVMVAAVLLRFWNLGHGIPYAIGVDEPEIMERVVHMMRTADFNPHFFHYPGFYFYVQLIAACARFITGAMGGLWISLDQVSAADFYFWGRAVTALFGSATVFLVHQIGQRWGARHALLAAGLMALNPYHVRESHYVLTDVPLTFFTTLTLLLTLRAHEKATPGAFAWAGAAAGLAAATKYNGAAVLLVPLIAAWMTPSEKHARIVQALTATGACMGAFLVAAPYTVLDLPAFLNGFGQLMAWFAPRTRGGEPGWLIYLKHLRGSLQWPALVLACGGLGFGIWRSATGPGRVRWLLIVVFPLVFFYMIATRYQIYGRYLLPILPFLCVLAANAVVSGVSLLRRFNIPRAPRTALITALTIAALLPPALEAIGFDRLVGKVSTQELAYQWITLNVPPKARVVIETRGLLLPQERYRVEYVARLFPGDYQDYGASGFDYAIASSQAYGGVLSSPQTQPEQYAAYRRLFDEAAALATITASDEHPGPELRIFKLRP